MMRIDRVLISLVGIAVLGLAVACGSAENDAPAAAQADLSEFPTPTRSLASTESDDLETPESSDSQTQPNDATDGIAENEPISEEELQQILQQVQSGEMSPEEFMQIAERLEAQFGGEIGGFGGVPGTQAFGTIQSVDGTSITIETETGAVTANLVDDTMISITSVLDPSELAEGMQVTTFSERVEGRTIARMIAVEPEGQEAGFGQRGQGGGQAGSGFGGAFAGRQRPPIAPGQGGFPGGNERVRVVESGVVTGGPGGPGAVVVFESDFTEDASLGSDGQAVGGFAGAPGVPPLFGSIESVDGNVITIDTQQGPLPVTLDDETFISQTKQGTIEDLRVGMQVTAFGPSGEDGTIEARVVSTIPEGIDDLDGFGGRRRAGFGRGVSGQDGQ